MIVAFISKFTFRSRIAVRNCKLYFAKIRKTC